MARPLRIVADQEIPLIARAFAGAAEVTLLDGRAINPPAIRQADALLVRSVTRVDAALLKGSVVRFVGSATSGVDHIDRAWLASAGIQFAHAPGSNARPVAEYALAGLFAMAGRRGFELRDKTVGIIGCGHTGSHLARFLTALGVPCLQNDPPLARRGAGGAYVALEAMPAADIISLHVPLNDAGADKTRRLINARLLSRLKADVILLNTARGAVIDEAALIRFRRQNPRASLILDVWQDEPQINPALLAETAIATPHIAGYSRGAKIRAARMLLAALAEFSGHEAATTDLDPLPKHGLELARGAGPDIIAEAVTRACDVAGDGGLLSGLAGLDKRQRGEYFYRARQHYPPRREFGDYIIQARGMAPDTAARLGRLGFAVRPA